MQYVRGGTVIRKGMVIPVIPGKPEKNTDKACTACRQTMMPMRLEVHGGFEMLLCIDFITCNRQSGVLSR